MRTTCCTENGAALVGPPGLPNTSDPRHAGGCAMLLVLHDGITMAIETAGKDVCVQRFFNHRKIHNGFTEFLRTRVRSNPGKSAGYCTELRSIHFVFFPARAKFGQISYVYRKGTATDLIAGLLIFGATDRDRTGTPLRTQDFKSWVSTYSTTVAEKSIGTN